MTYEPSKALVGATREALVAPLPFYLAAPLNMVPPHISDRAISPALKHVFPLALGTIAAMGKSGDRTSLTKNGILKSQVTSGLVRSIVIAFVPTQAVSLMTALDGELVALAERKYSTDGYSLELENGEIILVVTDTSRIRKSVESVADIVLHTLSSEYAIVLAVQSKILDHLRKLR